MDLGRASEARAQLEAGLAADPLSDSLLGKLADCDFADGLRERALEAKQAATVANPESANAWYGLGRMLSLLHRHDEALAALRKALALSDDDPGILGAYAHALSRAGRRDEARRVLDRMVAEGAARPVLPYDLAVAAAGLGDHDRALAWLAQAVDARYVGARFMARDASFVGLRDDARFRELVQRVGLTLPDARE